MKRITSLSILFAALIGFVIERARFDLWIVAVAIVTLLWNLVGNYRHLAPRCLYQWRKYLEIRRRHGTFVENARPQEAGVGTHIVVNRE
jgi:hypothetical protein